MAWNKLMITSETLIFRPEWTCGRYDKHTHSAIVYNLIEGLSHSFVDVSADVMGVILSHQRNTSFPVESIVDETGILASCVIPFVEELVGVGLLVTDKCPTQEGIAQYRAALSKWKKENASTTPERTEEKLPMEVTNAEMEYTERVGGVTSVMFEMTYRCPEKCIHCYNPGATRNDSEVSHRGDRAELGIEDYKRIVDELYEQGLFKVCLSGGDPFSNKATWELIEYLYNKEIAVDIFTNGLSIQHEVERLANLYPRLVGLSVYSGDASEHDFITRIKGSWEKTMHVADELSKLAVPMNLKCCVMRPNIKHYNEVNDIANNLGAKVQYEISITDSIEGDKCASKYLRLSKEQMEKVLRNDNVPLYVGKEAPNYGGQEKEIGRPMCGAAFNSFCITPEGNLIPCCAFHLVFGNLKTKAIKEILEESKELQEWRNTKIGDSEDCGKHEYCAYCNLCPGNNYSEHHNYMRAAENNCWLAKVRHELAMKMMDGYEPLKQHSNTEEFKIEDIQRVFS